MDALETAVALMVRKPNVPRSMVALAILGLQARNDYEAEGESLRRERKNAKAAGYRAESRATAMAKTLAALQADFDASAHGALKGEMELVANERDALKRRADVLEAEVQQLTGQADAMRREYTARLESVYSAINGPFPKKARQEASSTGAGRPASSAVQLQDGPNADAASSRNTSASRSTKRPEPITEPPSAV